MKSFLKGIAVFFGILFLSAVLVPLLYPHLPFKFERIFNRLVMVFSLAAIAAFVRIRREEWNRFGLAWRENSAFLFAMHFLAGLAILSLLVGAQIASGKTVWLVRSAQPFEWMIRLLVALLAGVAVGVLEEFFFRGIVYTRLSDRLSGNIPASIAITSVLYALIHFLGHNKPWIGPHPDFQDSLRLITAALEPLRHWQEILPEAFGLFLFGILLNLLLVRTGSLYPSMGLHAGCVFFIKLDGFIVDSREASLFLGTPKMLDGILGWFLLLVLGVFLLSFGAKKIRRTAACFLAVFLGITASSWALEKKSAWAHENSSASVAFDFAQHLNDAEVTSCQSQLDSPEGKEGMQGIRLHLTENVTCRIRFRDVPPGSRLDLNFFSLAAAAKGKSPANVYLRLWAGTHEIRRIRFAGLRDLQSETLDLGVLSFLEDKVIMTFELTADAPEGRDILLTAQLQP